jgi:formylmethanofuran dehydrogenase subunit E
MTRCDACGELISEVYLSLYDYPLCAACKELEDWIRETKQREE